LFTIGSARLQKDDSRVCAPADSERLRTATSTRVQNVCPLRGRSSRCFEADGKVTMVATTVAGDCSAASARFIDSREIAIGAMNANVKGDAHQLQAALPDSTYPAGDAIIDPTQRASESAGAWGDSPLDSACLSETSESSCAWASMNRRTGQAQIVRDLMQTHQRS
jgi:hypothetical protein